ncbi:hypothetical protein cypCar_00047208, partial [Cyprinus carpio]
GPDPALARGPARLPGADLVQPGDLNPALQLGADLRLEALQEVRVQSETTDAPLKNLRFSSDVYFSTYKEFDWKEAPVRSRTYFELIFL